MVINESHDAQSSVFSLFENMLFYYYQRHMVAHSGGRYGVQGYTRRSGINGQFSTVKSCVPALGKDGMPLKPSKVAMMLKKQKGPKTKLRKKYAYLDMHD